MSSQERDLPVNGPEVGEVPGQGALEQAPLREVATGPGEEALTELAAAQQEEAIESSSSGRLTERAHRAGRSLTEHSKKRWGKKEICRHYLGQSGQLLRNPQSNLSEGKNSFSQVSAEFRALMSGQR